MNTVAIVEDPTYLAREINYNHQQVVENGKSMLAYAADAGRGLIAVKGMLQHGEFGKWVKENCVFSHDTANNYMKLAKIRARSEFDPEQSIRSVLEAHATPRKPTTPHPTDLSHDDASHALKLQALVERGATEGERDVARRKLEAFAKGFGNTAEALVAKAESILPNHEKSSDQIERDKAREELAASQAEAAALRAQLNAIISRTQELEMEVQQLSRDELVARYIGLVLEREGLTKLKKAA